MAEQLQDRATREELGDLRDLYTAMYTARTIDLIEQSYTGRGEAFFHVSGWGHEAAAAANPFLGEQDWLHVHYRDKALALARGMQAEQFFLALFNKDGAHSRGRQMNAHLSAPAANILSIVGPVGNSPLQASGVAEAVRDLTGSPIVLCGLGDGMTQQGEVYEGMAQAVRAGLPVLFVIQDNAYAISTTTKGKTFYSLPDGQAESFTGIPITYVDGRDPLGSYRSHREVIERMRQTRKPEIIVFQVDRLDNHTNADDQRMYRTEADIAAARESGDPVARLRDLLLEAGYAEAELAAEEEEIRARMEALAEEAQLAPEPEPVTDAKAPLPGRLSDPASEYRGDPDPDSAEEAPLTMLEAIRETLRARMEADDRVVLFGEDIEDPKGDVFGITRGLTERYGRRVQNAPLAEASIVGLSVGRAIAGQRPVAFLQFADFLPIAYNQIFAELGSMYWRTDGGWQAPVIVMVTCGGYRPGLGPFHASSLEAIAAHTPGVDVVMPSSAGDAAGLLNTAFESGRPTIFFYPKNCLNDRSGVTSPDVARQLVPLGRARFVRDGNALTMVAWGNTVGLCVKAADALEAAGVSVDLIDLRSLVPWDSSAVIASVKKTGRMLVSHEDNHSAGFGAEVVATVTEAIAGAVQVRRVTRPDTYVPCNYANQLQILPSYQRILETAVDMLGGEVRWKKDEAGAAGVYQVEAIGSSPSDESISVITWHVEAGSEIRKGDLIADLEADKAAVDLKSPVSGTVVRTLAGEGDTVKVGTPILEVKLEQSAASGREHLKPVTRENPGTPLIAGIESVVIRDGAGGGAASSAGPDRGTRTLVTPALDAAPVIAGISTRLGSRVVTNEEIAAMGSGWTPEDIVKRTGIESRHWIGPGENAVVLGADAAEAQLAEHGISVREIDLLLVTTETPVDHTPSMATLIQYELLRREIGGDASPEAVSELDGPFGAAYDVNAACSGYLYGMQIAHDFLAQDPTARVLLVTTEELSPRVDLTDPGTAPIFGDAATATLVTAGGGTGKSEHGGGPAHGGLGLARIWRPVLRAHGESGDLLKVPETGYIHMEGPSVFVAAVKNMIRVLREACESMGIGTDDLSLVVPHQANQRIINAVRQRLRAPADLLYSNIRHLGNTSSCTIPLALSEILGKRPAGQRIGLTAFGGGFTFAGAVIETV